MAITERAKTDSLMLEITFGLSSAFFFSREKMIIVQLVVVEVPLSYLLGEKRARPRRGGDVVGSFGR